MANCGANVKATQKGTKAVKMGGGGYLMGKKKK